MRRPSPAPLLASGTAALLALGLAACAGASRPGAPRAAGDACVVVPGPAAVPAPAAANSPASGTGGKSGTTPPADAPRPVVLGVAESVDPAHAPVPRNAAERLVFAQLYQPVVRMTCDGRIEPVIAASWRAERDGRRWTFKLRRDASDWAGRPVTATDVAASWRAAVNALAGDRAQHPAARPLPDFVSITVMDPHTLRVELAEPVTIALFARPALAVRTTDTASAWPVGTGPYRPRAVPNAASAPGTSLSLLPRADGPRIDLRTVAGDARNALDAGVDLLVTTDPAVIDYAAASVSFRTVPLAWDRGYLLLADPAGAAPGAAATSGDPSAVRPPESALTALARDAVRVRARPAGEGFGDPAACADGVAAQARSAQAGGGEPGAGDRAGAARGAPAGDAPVRSPAARGNDRRIVYPAEDAVARSLAERLVALALDARRPDAAWLAGAAPELLRAGGRVSAVGVPAADFAAALRAGNDAAYVLPVRLGPGMDPCGVAGVVSARAPWLDRPTPQGSSHASIVPLIETRSTLVIGRAIGGVAVDGNGTLLLHAVRRATGEVVP